MDDKREIRSPGELSTLLRGLKQSLDKGEIEQLSVGSQGAPALHEVPDDGPWPDYLKLRFRTRNGRTYILAVETYHGAGGTWAPE